MDSKSGLEKIIQALGLTELDKHESLTFLIKQYNVRPSHIAFAIISAFLAIVLVIDGTNFLVSITCFLLPVYQCVDQLVAVKDSKTTTNSNGNMYSEQFVKNVSDEQFSRLSENHIKSLPETKQQIIEKYTLYLIFYTFCELLTPMMTILTSSVAWMILRMILCFLMLHPRIALVSKLKKLIKQTAYFEGQDQAFFQRRKVENLEGKGKNFQDEIKKYI